MNCRYLLLMHWIYLHLHISLFRRDKIRCDGVRQGVMHPSSVDIFHLTCINYADLVLLVSERTANASNVHAKRVQPMVK